MGQMTFFNLQELMKAAQEKKQLLNYKGYQIKSKYNL